MKDIKLSTRLQYNLTRIAKHFFGIEFNRQKLQRKILQEMQKFGEAKKLEIDIKSEISPTDFRENYLKKKRPLVLRQKASEWTSCQKWSPQFFKDNYGDQMISAMSSLPEDNENLSYSVTDIKMSDYIDDLESGSSQYYVRFNNFLYSQKELPGQLNLPFLRKYTGPLFTLGEVLQLFFGVKDSKTNLHAANLHNLFIQIHGKKRWVLYPCHYDPMLDPPVKREPYVYSNILPFREQEEFPIQKYLDYYDVTIEAGDILYLPSSMWHYVENKETSIGAAYKWYGPLSSSFNNFTQNLLITWATSPSLIYTFLNRKNLTKLYDYVHKKNVKQRTKQRLLTGKN